MENGADVTIPEETGYSPLDVATMMGSPRMVKMLLKAGADPLRMVQGWYPLHRACSGLSDDHTEIVEILLEHGVPHDLEGKAGKKCIDLCGRNYATYHEVMHRTMAELREGNKEEAENEFENIWSFEIRQKLCWFHLSSLRSQKILLCLCHL